MRFVNSPEVGVVELNFTWLPTWIGMNNAMKEDIEKKLGPAFVGRPLTDEVLAEMHQLIIDYISDKHPSLKGLRDYLDAVKFVEEQ